MLYHIVY